MRSVYAPYGVSDREGGLGARVYDHIISYHMVWYGWAQQYEEDEYGRQRPITPGTDPRT